MQQVRFRVSPHRHAAGRVVRLLVALVSAGPTLAIGDDCAWSPTAAQRARFELAARACGDVAAIAPSAPVSSESAHLRLFARPGPTVSAGAVAVVRPPRREPAAAHGTMARSGAASRAVQLAPRIDAAARRHDIDPLLLHAIAHVESRHDPAAVSPAGARGLMQVMPATGARFGADGVRALHDVDTNLEASAGFLKSLQQRFGDDLRLVLAAYNAGEGAVERHGRRVPPYAETRRYVETVLQRYDALRRTAGALRRATEVAR